MSFICALIRTHGYRFGEQNPVKKSLLDFLFNSIFPEVKFLHESPLNVMMDFDAFLARLKVESIHRLKYVHKISQ